MIRSPCKVTFLTGLFSFITECPLCSQKKQHKTTIVLILLTRPGKKKTLSEVPRRARDSSSCLPPPILALQLLLKSPPCPRGGPQEAARILGFLDFCAPSTGRYLQTQRHHSTTPPARRGHCCHLNGTDGNLLVVLTFPSVPEVLPAPRNFGTGGPAAWGLRRARRQELFPAL